MPFFFIFFFQRAPISFPYEKMGRANALYTVIIENVWTKVGLKIKKNIV
jgi:hypothetical protein